MDFPWIILVGCAQTAAVGDPMEVVGLLFFCALKFVRLLIQVYCKLDGPFFGWPAAQSQGQACLNGPRRPTDSRKRDMWPQTRRDTSFCESRVPGSRKPCLFEGTNAPEARKTPHKVSKRMQKYSQEAKQGHLYSSCFQARF